MIFLIDGVISSPSMTELKKILEVTVMKYDGYEVGPVLRKLRTDRNYTFESLSELSGLSVSTLMQMEQGGRNLSMKSLYILMEIYQVDANTILGLDEKRDKHSIDLRLQLLDDKKRAYLTETFVFMLDHAVAS